MLLGSTASVGTSSSSPGRKYGTSSFASTPHFYTISSSYILSEIKNRLPGTDFYLEPTLYFSGLQFSSTLSTSDAAQTLEIASSAAAAALSSADTRRSST